MSRGRNSLYTAEYGPSIRTLQSPIYNPPIKSFLTIAHMIHSGAWLLHASEAVFTRRRPVLGERALLLLRQGLQKDLGRLLCKYTHTAKEREREGGRERHAETDYHSQYKVSFRNSITAMLRIIADHSLDNY